MRLGEQWGQTAQTGLVIGLSGDLGAGKTQLVRGLARGLDIGDRVHSPTFALVNVYSGGRLTLFHLDLYRLDTLEQILAAGLEEFLRPDGVAVIEWVERLISESEIQSLKSKVPGSESRVQGSGSRVQGLESNVLGSFAVRYRQVWIEIVNETERRIVYEDFGA